MVTVDGWTVGAGKLIDLVHRIALAAPFPVEREIPVPPVNQQENESDQQANGQDPQKLTGPAGTCGEDQCCLVQKHIFRGNTFQNLPWRSVNVRWLRDVIPNNRFES